MVIRLGLCLGDSVQNNTTGRQLFVIAKHQQANFVINEFRFLSSFTFLQRLVRCFYRVFDNKILLLLRAGGPWSTKSLSDMALILNA